MKAPAFKTPYREDVALVVGKFPKLSGRRGELADSNAFLARLVREAAAYHRAGANLLARDFADLIEFYITHHTF